MKVPFLKCVSCSENNGDTQIKIKSSCFEKPFILKFDSNDNESVAELQRIFNMIIGVSNSDEKITNENEKGKENKVLTDIV